jgi:hypothetical protein
MLWLLLLLGALLITSLVLLVLMLSIAVLLSMVGLVLVLVLVAMLLLLFGVAIAKESNRTASSSNVGRANGSRDTHAMSVDASGCAGTKGIGSTSWMFSLASPKRKATAVFPNPSNGYSNKAPNANASQSTIPKL